MASSSSNNWHQELLGLPREVVVPDHYELLGLPRFCADADRIQDAALQRNLQLHKFEISEYHSQAVQLENEVVQALTVLEDPVQRAEYDVALRRKLGIPEPSLPRTATASPSRRVPAAAAATSVAKRLSEEIAVEESERSSQLHQQSRTTVIGTCRARRRSGPQRTADLEWSREIRRNHWESRVG